MLPVNTLLGQVELSEIYEYFDGPRLFSVRDNAGGLCLAYWFDESEEATGWLYLPITENKLTRLRQQQLTLRQAYEEPETFYWVVYTRIPPNEDSARLVTRQQIDSDFFPPEGYYIQYADAVSEAEKWVFETRLEGKNLSADLVSRFIGRLRDVVENAAERTLQLFPRNALAGSLDIRFDANDVETALRKLKEIVEAVQAGSRDSFFRLLSEHKIDPVLLQDLLFTIRGASLNIEIAPKLESFGQVMHLPLDAVDQALAYLQENLRIYVESIKVPQANNLDTVLRVLELVNQGDELSVETIGGGLTAPRQVNYYRDAAWSSNLISRDLKMTTLGRFVASLPDRDSQYRALADSFDSTDVGWAWLRWAGVQYMTQLDPASAEAFLLDSATELSAVTAHRRASTLQQWVEKLQPYHRHYQDDGAQNKA